MSLPSHDSPSHSHEGGNPVQVEQGSLDPRLRGDDEVFSWEDGVTSWGDEMFSWEVGVISWEDEVFCGGNGVTSEKDRIMSGKEDRLMSRDDWEIHGDDRDIRGNNCKNRMI